MDTTRVTLIQKVRDPRDSKAWEEFYALYGPLVYGYARKKGLSRDDAEDIRGQIMSAVVQQIASFEYDKAKGGFKNWLRRMTHNKIVDQLRKRREKQEDSQIMGALPDKEPLPDEEWERQWKNAHLRHCVEQIRPTVSEQNYRAFHLLVLEECPVEEVCRTLNINTNQAYKAKSRLLALIRDRLTEYDL